MTAEIVSVGTEILMGQIVDTNAQAIGKLLPELGITHRYRQTVGDNLERVTSALNLALSRSDIVFTIGGLGPTQDDLTREAIAEALGDPLVEDSKITERLSKLFASRGLTWTESQRRQAMRPGCAEPIDNPNGTAPGLVCRMGGKTIFALPGPRTEFIPMLEGPVREMLNGLTPGVTIVSRLLRVIGLGESLVEQRVAELLANENPSIAPYAHPGEVHLRLTASAPSEADANALLDPFEAKVRAILGSAIYASGDLTIEGHILKLLYARGQTLAVAESCTGGGLGARLTGVPGSSAVFLGGVISYANEVKERLLSVHPGVLLEKGAVSAECAREMAEGAKGLIGADWALSITGVAGPGGGSEAKPVGLIYIGWSGPDSSGAQEFKFRGSRESIRIRSIQSALVLLREKLEGL
ncbi:MAG: competence/damage-inducible protein A [Armatimonadetes bacterium]|nr:competence/damage-inducible protein A [Armatimonadota bacterium]